VVRLRNRACGPMLQRVFSLTLVVLLCLLAARAVRAGTPAAPPAPPADTRFRVDSWLWETKELVPQVGLPSVRATYSSPFDWAPNSGILLFAEYSEAGGRLAAVSLRTLRKYTIADTPARITSVRWSPDGRAIAYHTSGESEEQQKLAVLALSSAHNTLVAEGVALLWRVEWSPDSRRLAASISGPRGRGLAVWQMADGSARQLCWVPGASLAWHDPVWSPDCERIAARDPAGQIVVLDVTSGKTAVEPAAGTKAISASPNLNYLLALADGQAVVVEVRTGRQIPVVLEGVPAMPQEPYIDTGPIWFGDSSAFAVSQDRRLWVVDPATGQGRPIGPRQVSEYPRLERSGPSGMIAYHQGTEDAALNGLCLLTSATSEPRILLRTAGHGWQWSPGGKWGTYRIRSPVDPRDASSGQYTWDLLLRVGVGRLYHLTHEGWTARPRDRRLFWSPNGSQALVWFDDGPCLLTLPE